MLLMFISSQLDHQTADLLFVTSIVKAAMKKKVSYNVKLIIEKSNIQIKNSHCECPSGKGPHSSCKHVAASLLVIEKFANSGILNVSKSCTETLQSFNTPKKMHKGGAMTIEKICGQKSEEDDDDPRPKHFRNNPNVMSHLQNLTTNFALRSGIDVSWRYVFPKASLVSASHDHDYLNEKFPIY